MDELAEIAFPVAVLGEAVWVRVRVERMPALDRQERFAVGQQKIDAIDILSDARSGEASERRLDGVTVRFLGPGFSGSSFGLALALADKRARHPAPPGEVIATGCLPCGGRGTVEKVDGFEAKARLLLASLGDRAGPVTFACPAANLDEAGDTIRSALGAAEEAGRLSLRPVEHLEELSDLWMIPKASAPRSRRMSPWLLAGGPALAIAVAVAAVTWRMVAERPVRRCEAALTAMEQGDGSRDPERIRGAVDQCGAAARGRPDSGRAQFLAGQAHSLNGGSRLASAYWRRAALAGDPDGLAAHGRDLWLSGPGDGATMREALRLLERAADRGSAAAVEDMAEIYRDGIGVAIDLPRAEQLLKRAGEIRRDNDR